MKNSCLFGSYCEVTAFLKRQYGILTYDHLIRFYNSMSSVIVSGTVELLMSLCCFETLQAIYSELKIRTVLQHYVSIKMRACGVKGKQMWSSYSFFTW